jgi:hypothetical protein
LQQHWKQLAEMAMAAMVSVLEIPDFEQAMAHFHPADATPYHKRNSLKSAIKRQAIIPIKSSSSPLFQKILKSCKTV